LAGECKIPRKRIDKMGNLYFKVEPMLKFEFTKALICGSMICKEKCDSLVSNSITTSTKL
jgi:hypothetical protein